MKIWITIFIGISSVLMLGKTPDILKLEREIANLSRMEEYEAAIEKLQWIVLDSNSSNTAKAEAYFLKHEIYSKIGIYTEATSNLKWFMQQATKISEKSKIYEGRYKLASAILSCKKLDYQSAILQLEELRSFSTGYTPTEFGLYLFLEGLQKMEKGKAYDRALIDFEGAIELLKQEVSDYLPMVYKEQLRLYSLINKHDKVVESYTEGIRYGKELKVTTDLLELYRFMANYYKSIGWNKESFALSELVLEQGTIYNSPRIGSKLHFVEKDVLNRSKLIEHKKNKRIQVVLLVSVFCLCLLLVFSFIAYKKNRNRKVLIEIENHVLKINYTILKQEKKKVDEPLLTERQIVILSLVKQGKTNKEIATHLCISENTVKYHLKIIYLALKVNGRSDLV